MGWFDSFRIHGGPTLYPSNKTPVTVDVTEWGFAFSILIIIFSFLIILPGFRGKERWYFFIRAAVGCFVLVSIMVCNFGQEWEKAEVHNIRTYYKAGISKEIEHATVAVKIGLRSVNITLKTDPVHYKINNKTTEIINYNERFHWNDFGWTQGRGGFGPFATLVNREYREAQLKGSPFPILWIAEYFTIDGEGIRWGRFYRQAGYFTHALLWLALPLWVITIMLFKIVLEFGAYFSMATGAVLLLGNVIYATVRNPLDLQIHIGDDVLRFAWGWTFWLNLVNGLIALFIGIVVWFMNLRFTEAIFTFFGVDILMDIEEYYASIEELRQMGIHIAKPTSPAPRKGRANPGFDTDPGDVVINAQEKDVELYDNVEGITRGFRRKNQGTFAKRFDRSIKAKSRKTESRVDISSPYFYGAPYESYQSWAAHHPHEAFFSQSEYSFRDGILRAPSHHSTVWSAEKEANGIYGGMVPPSNMTNNGVPLPPDMDRGAPPQNVYEGLPPHLMRNGIYNAPPPINHNGKPPPHNSNGLPPGLRPVAKEILMRHRRSYKKPKFTFKRGYHHKNRNKGGWRGSDPGHLPIHSSGSIPVSYNSKRYSGHGSLTSVNGYYASFGMTSSDSMLFPQGSRWRPPGGQTSSSSSNSQNNSARNSLIRHIGDPNYPYKTHSSSASSPSSNDYSDQNQLYAMHHGVQKRSSGGKKR